MADRGYDEDLAQWCESQARALRDGARAGTNLPIDWENVAEEIESMGKSQGRELASRIAVILLHLMKLETSPATEPRGIGTRRSLNTGTTSSVSRATRQVCGGRSPTRSSANSARRTCCCLGTDMLSNP